ncbi:hypothetical protein DRQ25_09125 [Candidatus Fermentibacteria bacterium]|nr:MAG: hypothetical protein DRQ25_09125 [Candidatus Fermentibacteria bacterium]
MIQRIGFYFNMSRKEILWEMTLVDLFNYNKNSLYFYLESQGKKVKKPTGMQDREYQKEHKERLLKLYGEG